MMDIAESLQKLTRVGTALTSERDLSKLLETIVSEARALTNADAGSLYIKEGEVLNFVVSQNETLRNRYKDRGLVMEKFKPFPLPITNESIAGYAANNAELLNIPDVNELPPGKPFRFNKSYDEKNDYVSKSMLTAPMIDPQGEVVGVVQLINARCWSDSGERCFEVVPFDELAVETVKSMASQAAVAIINARLTESLKKAYLETIHRLSMAAEYKDHDTANHIKRMSLYSHALARYLGMSEKKIELILYSSPMHDVGKLGVPDAILLKPARLDPDERKIMENHTVYGAKILEGSDSEVLELSRVIALTHHEKWDGSGYPRKLKGEDIPLEGRIVALADVFDALTSKRPYKRAWTLDEAMSEIKKDAGTHFDPDLVEAFCGCFDKVEEIYRAHQDEAAHH